MSIALFSKGQFVPQLRLFSGKVFEDDGQDQTEFVEKAVEEAVRTACVAWRTKNGRTRF